MTNEEIIKTIEHYLGSLERKRIVNLQELYEADNPAINELGLDRQRRRKTPNHIIPTAYYSTLVDTMAGYMFQDIQYNCANDADKERLDEIFKANMIDVEDMKMGIASLAYDKGVEYVYTNEQKEIRVAKLNAANTIIIKDETIEEKPIAAINFTFKNNKNNEYSVMYIEPKLYRAFRVDSHKVVGDIVEQTLYFDDLPVIEYKAQIIGNKAPFEVCVPYINALDALLSGNSNDVDRIVDALLVLGKSINDEDLQHMDEWKVLQDMSNEERAEYIAKDTSPEFRKYVSEVLIREIHKHSHVIDWYSSDSNSTQDASGKALKTRLFDMDMYSKRIEMAYKEGAYNRIKAINKLLSIQKKGIGGVDIVYNRTMIDDFIDDAEKLERVGFLSDETKREIIGVDEKKEQKRLKKEKAENGVDVSEDPLMRSNDVVGITKTGISLNGAQIQAVSDLAQKVGLGQLSRPEAVNLAMLLGLDRATAESVIPEQGDAEAANL